MLVVKSVKLSRDVVDEVERSAAQSGLTFSDLVEFALRKELKMSPNNAQELVLELADWLRSRYPAASDFPLDVTLHVIHQMRDDAVLRSLYDDATRGAQGEVDPEARRVVHQQVGRMVKRVLGARVVGRSNLLDPAVHLITSHALLAREESTHG